MLFIVRNRNYISHRKIGDKKEYYIAFVGKKQYRYSVSRYGEYAKKLALLSLINNEKFFDYFTIENDVIKFHVYTKKYGIKFVFVDIEDFYLVKDLKISISRDKYTYYAKTKKGAIHRLIMNVSDSNLFVDHIDHNGLNNCKNNLRIVDCSINNKNAKIRCDNKINFRGVYKNNKGTNISYTATWRDNNHKIHSKSFSINKYGNDVALQLAKEYRLQKEKEFNYIPIESSTTIPKGSTT